MPSSLRNGSFEVYLQPKVRLADSRVDGAEALIRWNHPEKGMLSPGVFIPILEKAKLISLLDHFMFEEVCKLLHRWRQEGRETCVISVNLSRQNLAIPDLLQQYLSLIHISRSLKLYSANRRRSFPRCAPSRTGFPMRCWRRRPARSA